MSAKGQKAICILGMHRSGSSAITRAVNLLGPYLGPQDRLMPPAEGNNPDGFWEHMEILSFHERLLKTLSRSWDSASPMPEQWWTRADIEPYRQELTDFIREEFREQSIWLWKDPRSSLLLPLWHRVLRALDIDVSYVLCLRNPLDVAESLKRRDGLSKNRSFNLWLLHTASACYWTNGAKRIVICYDHLLADWEESLRKVSTAFDLPWPQDDRELKKALSDFVKLDSRHSYSDLESLLNDKSVSEHVVSFYRLLLDCEKDQNLLGSSEFKEYTSKLFDSYQPRTYPPPSISAPKVSVVIPSYNHGKYIAETIESVLCQTYQDFEIIITDDGSSDDTVQEIQKFKDPRIKFFRFEKNQGQFIAMRKCIKEAKGEYIAVLNSDDAFLPEKLETQVEFLNAHPEIAAVFTYAALIDDDGNDFTDKTHFYYDVFKQPNRSRHEWLNHFFYKGNCLCHPSVVIRNECHKTIGHYEGRFGLLADLDFWVRLCFKKEIHIIPENLVKFRIRKEQPSANTLETRIRDAYEFSRILEHYLNIDSVNELTKIFKRLPSFGNPLRDDFIPFYVAMLALEVDSPSYQLFGLNTLFYLLQDKKIARLLDDNYRFGYKDFIRLTGRYDIFNTATLRVNDLSKALQDRKQHIKNLEYILQEKEAHIKNLEHQWEENYRDWQAHTKNLELIVKDKDTHIANLEIAVRDKDAHLSNLEAFLRNKDGQIGNLEAIIKDKDTHIENLKHQGEENYRDWQAHVQDLESILQDREQHIRNLERQREENYRDWEAREKNLRAIVEDKDTHIENLQAAMRDKDSQLRNLEVAVKAKDAHISNLEPMISEKDAHITNLESEVKDKEARVVNLEAEVRSKDDQIRNLERQREENYRDWETREKNLRAIVEDKDTHIGNLQTVMRDKDSQLRNLEVAVKAKDAHISNLEPMISEKDAHITNLESEVKDKEAHVVNLEAEVRSKDDQIRNLENSIKDKEATLNRIYNSYGLGALLVCNKMVDKLFPLNSKRRLFAKIILSAVKNPKAILKNLNKNNIKLFFHYVKNVEPTLIGERAETVIFKQAIFMFCDKAVLDPAMAEVAGWAISTEGIEKIEVYCDEALLGNASYGLPRPDVNTVYPFIKNSENSGFSSAFKFEKPLSVGRHEIIVKAIAYNGKTSEIRQLIDAADPYPRYLKRTTPKEGTLQWMMEISKNFMLGPFISLCIMVKKETLQHLDRSLDSLTSQAYPLWNILLFFDLVLTEEEVREVTPFQSLHEQNKLSIYPLSELNHRLSLENCDFLGFINSGDLLHPHTFFEIVKKINMGKTIDLIYTDEDTLIDGERKDPIFKPDWSPDLLLSMNYIGQFFLIRKELFTEVGGLHYGFTVEGIYDLLLRATERTEKIGHIPLVLYTKDKRVEYSQQTGKRVLEESLIRRGIDGEVIPLEIEGAYRVKRNIIGNPKVSIIILTAYKNPQLFEECLKSLVIKSTYNNYEVILVDHTNGKLPKEFIKELISESKLQIIDYRGSFNFSRMNNLAATKATGDYLILLNDDTEVITPDWIESMLEHAQQPGVGVVGVKLLYHDNTIQHVGMFLVDYGGGARHAFRFTPPNANGYMGLLRVARNCSAVTFACVMIPRDIFFKLKGLDENLKMECNDVDFCLRVLKNGHFVVWTPFAILYHKELTTRIRVYFKDDIDYFWNRWQCLLEKGDPYYNPNLTLDSDDFSLNMRPVLIEHHEPTF